MEAASMPEWSKFQSARMNRFSTVEKVNSNKWGSNCIDFHTEVRYAVVLVIRDVNDAISDMMGLIFWWFALERRTT